MNLGESVVARTWSWTNDDNDIPYFIKRYGRTKKNGGTGYKWSCSCPHHTNRHVVCKHLKAFHDGVRTKSILADKRFEISDWGFEILGIGSR